MDRQRPRAVRSGSINITEWDDSFGVRVLAGLTHERRTMMTLTIKLEATTERDPLSYGPVPHTLRGVLGLMRDVIGYSWRESTRQLRTYPPMTLRLDGVELVPSTDRASIAFRSACR
jgi:hypothetical protein